jgi:site-specific recombinase XerD
MSNQLTVRLPRQLAPVLGGVPTAIAAAGEQAAYRFVRFFVETIRNQNTRHAYARAVRDFFAWCDAKGLSLSEIEPIGVSAYVEQLTAEREPATVKQHLAAIRMLFDWLVTGGIVPFNPASSVRGPRMSYRRGKTPILDAEECRQLIDSIDVATIAGMRDRALIGCLVYSFARVSAAIGMDRGDYRTQGKKTTFRLHEKGGKFNEVPAHHIAEQYMDEYLAAARIIHSHKDTPLFRSLNRRRRITDRRLDRREALDIIKRRARRAGLPSDICCHTFRGTGITNYLENGGDRSKAAQIAGHASERTTSLYDRRNQEVERSEIERVRI